MFLLRVIREFRKLCLILMCDFYFYFLFFKIIIIIMMKKNMGDITPIDVLLLFFIIFLVFFILFLFE